MPRNPLRLDPTRTGMIRRAFCGDMSHRLDGLRRQVWKYVYTEDQLGITGKPTINAAKKFVFETDDQKLTRFNRWLKGKIDDGILSVSPSTGNPKGGKPWTAKYIDSAYRKGSVKSFTAMHPKADQKMPFYEGTKKQFLDSAFARPERVSKLRLLYTRSYENLKGITSSMASKMSRIMADGMAHGKGPVVVARNLSQTVAGLSRDRALTLARTEIINAHAEGQLDSLEEMGVEEVSADVEFTTAGDDGVCPECEDLDGEVYTIDEARGVIPLHPNCRCSWSPHFSDEDK